MGTGCCGKLYEGIYYSDYNGLLCKRRSAWSQTKNLPIKKPSIVKHYHHLSNKFTKPDSFPFIFGLAGIQNIGNTCFISSALQCLSNVQPLTDYFLSHLHEEELNPKFNGEVSSAYGEFIKAQWTEDFEYIQPSFLCSLIQGYAPEFSAGDQHDSQEFLSFFLNSLHEELNRSEKTGLPRVIEDCGEKYEIQAASAWKESLLYNASIIIDLFQGQYKSTLKCVKCSYEFTTFENFMMLTVPIPNVMECTLDMCIKEFAKEEVLNNQDRWNCHGCGHKIKAKKKIDVWKFPPILIVNLKRFQFKQRNQSKIDRLVKFPIKDYDLSSHDVGPYKIKPVYKLFAIIDYFGTGDLGHYIAHAKNHRDQKWYTFDDDKVIQVLDENDLVTNSAYVLFYHNDNMAQFPRQSPELPKLWPHCISEFSVKVTDVEYISPGLLNTGHSFA